MDTKGHMDPNLARQKELMGQNKPKGSTVHNEKSVGSINSDENINAKLENPLAGISLERLQAMGRAFAHEKGLEEYEEEFAKGAMVAQNPLAFESLPMLEDADKNILRREVSHKWDHPMQLYMLVICCSVAAAVQGKGKHLSQCPCTTADSFWPSGMDESVTNGANLFWAPQFGLDTAATLANGQVNANAGKNQWLLGLTAGAPYLACAVLGCWLTSPLNRFFGRRGAIFITATVSALACIWSGVTNSWPHLFASRFVLGLGIGAKSATVPVYAAETAPPLIRGALVMVRRTAFELYVKLHLLIARLGPAQQQWQVWTAFGIMLGTVSSLIFFRVKDPAHITGLNWRLMLGSAALPAFFVMAQVYTLPESPRWLLSKGRYAEAFKSLCRLRHTRLQAARDLFFIHALLEEESTITTDRPAFIEMFAVHRNRRAALASGIVMFMQQFCGINVIAYYSSTVFREAGFSELNALGATLGFGALNWIMAAPAVWTIDTFGRRTLLLTTFPLMALFLLMTGMAFFIPEESKARVGVVALGIYLHCMAYSPGEGPVPFTYSAEAFPLYIRETGMSFATAVTWGWNFIVALTFPRLLGAFKPQGAFGWYAAWNIIGWCLILCFVPETKALSLEELDQVFSVPTKKHAAFQLRATSYFIRKHILRQQVGPQERLYHWDNKSNDDVPRRNLGGAEVNAPNVLATGL
ncbi:BQ2448_7716 [Microbotryum intermedium]|uniref:BQ2448_7716 protein n=1 Tax=Microbotryum intermedium TaxID=269621 RepID=A0A238FN25_9BASI|nr:BQ2448_7716 [Microbotryum intermedium]